MATRNEIRFGIGFDVDNSSLNKLKQELQSLKNVMPKDLMKMNKGMGLNEARSEFMKMQKEIGQIEIAFQKAFNPAMGATNIAALNTELKKINLNNLSARMQKFGVEGRNAFYQISKEALTTQLRFKETNNIIDKMGQSLVNTIKWSISSSAVHKFTGSIQEAWGYVKNLDRSLNDIRIVTGYSADQMNIFAEKANKAAKALGATTVAYTDAALTFYQQGLSEQDVEARANLTLKVSNVTGLDSAQSAEYVTSVLNGYKVAAADAEEAMDKLAAVGAQTASSLSELAEGMAQVSSAANAMGVSEDQLAASLATVISVTREDASTIGTAFKTIYARISAITAGTADAEVSLGQYTSKMKQMGFNVLDSTGHLRDLGEVMEEIGGSWANLTREQQVSLAQTMAGTRQYSKLIALFDNWDEYQRALNVSMEANGTLQEQQNIYMESTAAHLQKLKAAKEGVFDSLMSGDSFNGIIDGLTKALGLLEKFIDAIGGGGTALLTLGSLATNIFGKQISTEIGSLWTKAGNNSYNEQQIAGLKSDVTMYGAQQGMGNQAVEKMTGYLEKSQQYWHLMSQEEIQAELELAKMIGDEELLNQQLEDNAKSAKEYVKARTEKDIDLIKNPLTNEEQNETSKAFKQIEKDINNANQALEEFNNLKSEGQIGKGQPGNVNEKRNALLMNPDSGIRKILGNENFYGYDKGQELIEKIEEQNDIINNKEGAYSQEQINSAYDKRAKLLLKIKDLLNECVEEENEQYQAAKETAGAYAEQKKNLDGNAEKISDTREAELKKRKKAEIGTAVVSGAMGAISAGSIIGDTLVDVADGTANIGSVIGQTAGSVLSLVPAMKDLNAVTKGFGGSIMIAVTAAMALGKVIKYFITVTSSAYKAKQAVEQTGAALEKARQTSESFKSSVETYDSLVETLNKCKTGTQEWRDALTQVNDQVTQMLEDFPELADYISHSASGALTISNEGVEAAQKLYENRIKTMQAANLYAKTEQQLAGLTDLSHDAEELEEALKKYKQAQDVMAEIAIGDSYVGKYEDDVNAITSLGKNLFINVQEEIKNEILKATKEGINAISGANDAEVKALWARYSEATGTNYTLDKNAVRGTDANRYFVYLDEDGNSQKISAETLAAEIAAAEALQKVEENGNNAAEMLSNLKGNLSEVDFKGLSDWIASGSFEDMNEADFNNLLDEIKNKGFITFLTEKTGMSDEELQQYLGKDYKKNFYIALKTYGTTVEDFQNEMFNVTNQAFEELGNKTQNLAPAAQKSLLKLLNDSFINFGENGQSIVSNIFKNLEPEEMTLFLDSIEGIDWDNATVDTFRKTLHEAGIETNFTDQALNLFIDTMKGAKTAAESFDGLSEEYESIHKIIDKIKTGDTISPEDYAKLDDSMKPYFTMMLDGTYKLTESAESFYNLVEQNQIDKRLEEIKRLQAENADLQSLINVDNFDEFSKKAETPEQAQEQLNYLKLNGKTDNETIAKLQDWIITEQNQDPDAFKVDGTEQMDAHEYNRIYGQLPGLNASLTDSNTENQIDNYEILSNLLKKVGQDVDALNAQIDSNNALILQQEIAIGMSATSFEELRQMYKEGEISLEAYNTAAVKLDNIQDTAELDPTELKEYREYLQDVADESDELADTLTENADAANIVAKSIMKMNKGVEALKKDFKTWGDILRNSTEGSQEYADAMDNTKDALADVLDINKEFISNDFVKEHLDEISKAAKGDAEAIDSLRAELVKPVLAKILLENNIDPGEVSDEFANVQSMIDAYGDLEVGVVLNDNNFMAACNEMIAAAGMTAEQANALFDSMGFEATFASEGQPVQAMQTVYTKEHRVEGLVKDEDGPISWRETEEIVGSEQVPIPGEVTTFAMSTNGAIPKIKSLTKKATGASNNASSSNKGGKKSGGGGGSKQDKKDYKTIKTDRYHDVNNSLKEISNDMEKLADSRKLLAGDELAKTYENELNILAEQVKTLNEKRKIQEQEQAELQASLGAQGAQFDENGNITNYNQALVAKTDWINGIIEGYNNMSAEEQEAYKQTLENAEKEYDKFKEDMERYETLVRDEMEENAKAITKALEKEIELKIERFSMTIDLRIDTRDFEKEVEDFKHVLEKDTALNRTDNAANNLATMMDAGMGIGNDIAHVNQIQAEIRKMQAGQLSDIYSAIDPNTGQTVNDMKGAEEDLEKYTKSMIENVTNVKELIDQINQGLLDTYSEIQDEFDKQLHSYEAIDDQLIHSATILEKLYGEDEYKQISQIYEQQYQNALSHVDMLRKDADFWQTQMEKAQTSEAYEAAKEKWESAIQSLNDTVEQTLDTIMAQYENKVRQAFDVLSNELTNGKGLDYVGEEWELINENADRYLDTINATYEVQKLQDKYLTSIDEVTNIQDQEKLNKLMQEELEYLEKKDKLTQYDIDRANLKYEIALKQIALEEAQQNKSKLRLKRDSQGNYSYQYVGDEDAISKAQQELSDAQNQLYNLDKDEYRKNLDDILSYYTDFQDKMIEVAIQYGAESAEYEQYKLLYAEQYGELINGIVAENETIKRNLTGSTMDALQDMYNRDTESFREMTDMNIENFQNFSYEVQTEMVEGIVRQFNTSIQDMINAFSGEEGFEGIMKNVWNEITLAAQDYQDKIQAISSASEEDLSQLQEETNEVLNTMRAWVEENDKIINNSSASVEAYNAIAASVKDLSDSFDSVKKQATEAATQSANLISALNSETWKELEAQKALDNLLKALNDWNSTPAQQKTFTTTYTTDSSGGGSSGPGIGSAPTALNTNNTTPTSYYYPVATNKYTKKIMVMSDAKFGSIQAANEWWKHNSLTADYIGKAVKKSSKLLKKGNAFSALSGGYTGAWFNGSKEENGRLAFLHQKELVLNRTDTERILDTVKMLREFDASQVIEQMASNADNLMSSMDGDYQNRVLDRLDTIIQAMERTESNYIENGSPININASFTGGNAEDIEQALLSLTNKAAQRAFNIRRKK